MRASATESSAEGGTATRNTALSNLFIAHNQELIAFLMTRLTEAEAHEVAQEAYARLLRLDQPETLSFLRAYLFKTAANLSIDRLRHRHTRQASQPQIGLLQQLGTEPTPEELTSRRQEAQLAARILGELPEACRRAFLLYRVYDYPLADVAREMGVSERMIRYYVVQAMDHCRVRMSAERQEKDAER
ncbi:MAG TPA: sigma-70 family RNA polymerase sigma factor [Steroidobacteraceae bacterium]|nr:sigma-70 family RNA polymerase sigma factor [Steroidobacteraceae bacterium]